jgi:hypothetical protein
MVSLVSQSSSSIAPKRSTKMSFSQQRMDMYENAFYERGASVTDTTLVVVFRSWHKIKCHVATTRLSQLWGSWFGKDCQQKNVICFTGHDLAVQPGPPVAKAVAAQLPQVHHHPVDSDGRHEARRANPLSSNRMDQVKQSPKISVKFLM